jgi:hypothetical protein
VNATILVAHRKLFPLRAGWPHTLPEVCAALSIPPS